MTDVSSTTFNCSTLTTCSESDFLCNCIKCTASYVLVGNLCCISIPNCSTYDLSCVCSACSTGYTLLGSSCTTGSTTPGGNIPCTNSTSNCQTFTTTCVCSTCNPSYHLTSLNECCLTVSNCDTYQP